MTDHEHWWMAPAPEIRWRDLLYLLVAGVVMLGLEFGIMWLLGDLT